MNIQEVRLARAIESIPSYENEVERAFLSPRGFACMLLLCEGRWKNRCVLSDRRHPLIITWTKRVLVVKARLVRCILSVCIKLANYLARSLRILRFFYLQMLQW